MPDSLASAVGERRTRSSSVGDPNRWSADDASAGTGEKGSAAITIDAHRRDPLANLNLVETDFG